LKGGVELARQVGRKKKKRAAKVAKKGAEISQKPFKQNLKQRKDGDGERERGFRTRV
jgi:hypothetical protein